MKIVKNQQEFDKAIAAGETELEVAGGAYIEVRSAIKIILKKGEATIVGRDSAEIYGVSWGSSTFNGVSWGSSTFRGESWGSSTFNGVSRDSSTFRGESWGSSTFRGESWDSSTFRGVSWGSSTFRGVSRDSSTFRGESWGSSTFRGESWDSSTFRGESWGSSTFNGVSRDSSTFRGESWGSSTFRGESWDSSTFRGVSWGSSTFRGEGRGFGRQFLSGKGCAWTQGPNCYTILHQGAHVTGGSYRVLDISTPALWADFHGLESDGDLILVYKAVGENFISPRGGNYSPGQLTEAPDWDGGIEECGRGLHFSPSPKHALTFNGYAKKFVGCWIDTKECRAVKEGDSYPEKIKAKRVVRPCFEVDRHGEPVKVSA